jgi:hypothetical protein
METPCAVARGRDTNNMLNVNVTILAPVGGGVRDFSGPRALGPQGCK